MEFSQLEYFLETAQREHITQAAQALNITQPALSNSIARLEAELNCDLFVREGRRVRLSESGAIVKRYAQQILFQIGDMQAELEALRGGMSGSLRIGSSFPAQEPNWLLGSIQDFSFTHPDVSISLRQLPQDALPTSIEERRIDLAVSSEPILAPGIRWLELFTEPMGIILAADHPLAKKKKLSMADLMLERFYCNNASSDVTRLTRLFCHLAGFEPNIHFEGDFPSFIGQAVSLGYGISFISYRGYQRSEGRETRESWEENIVYRPLREDYCRRTCGLAYLAAHEHFPVLDTFRDQLVSQFQNQQGDPETVPRAHSIKPASCL